MLQFWKRSGRKEKTRSQSSVKETLQAESIEKCVENVAPSLQEEICQNIEDNILSEANKRIQYHSRLSKTLQEVLSDKGALGYFIQFMDSQSALPLIKFWLDVESFRSAAACVDNDDMNTFSPSDFSLNSNYSINSTDMSPTNCVALDINNTAVPSVEVDPSAMIKNDIQDKTGSESVISLLGDLNICDNNLGCADRSIDDNKIYTNATSLRNEIAQLNIKMPKSKSLSLDDSISIESVYITTNSDNDVHLKLNGTVLDEKVLESHNRDDDIDNTVDIKKSVFDFNLGSKCSMVKNNDHSDLDRCSSASSLRKRKSVYECIHEDAVRIVKRYLTESSLYAIKLPDNLRADIQSRVKMTSIDPELFAPAQKIVFDQIENNYFNEFHRSDFHCKHQVDVLTSGEVLLDDILFNETALFYFMEFLEQEAPTHRNLLEFWLSAVNFSNFIEGNNQAQSDAVILYDKYFSLQATNSLNLGNDVRFKIEENICRENGPLPNCFDLPMKIVHNFLEKNYLKQFLSSQLFFKYLSELINTIQSNPWPKFRHRKTGSDASSEISIHNTLLAMENRPKSMKFDMNIENSRLTDPDSLWRRNQIGLKFGRVNELGRFQSDLEKDPEVKQQWNFSRAVKKFVSKDDASKEEMAWQVAEMIVKDITNVTLNQEFDSSDSS